MTNQKYLWKGRYIAIQQQGDWEYVTRIRGNSAVVIIAMTDDGELLLVEQFRAPLGQSVLELPAGLVADEDPDETFMQAAARELLEETGYQAVSFEHIISGPVSAGLSNEIIHLVRATKIKYIQNGGGVDGENITVHKIPCEQLVEKLHQFQKNGVATDPKIITALGLCQN